MYFKKYFFKKKYLKVISKVDVNFDELQVEFNMQSLKKMVLRKTMFNGQKSEI